MEFITQTLSGIVELWRFLGFAIYYSSLPGKILFLCLGLFFVLLHIPPIVWFVLLINVHDFLNRP